MTAANDAKRYEVIQSEDRPNAPKVSVLTPIYNVEKFLTQCLDSLKGQTLQEIEFICINDGSTDGCLGILQDYAKSDPRFVIINKANSGYGASMNIGINEARGEYIGIVESDDYADTKMFESLYNLASGNDCDIARGNRYNLSEDGDVFNEVLKGLPYNTVFRPTSPEGQGVFVPAPCIWSQIYKKSFLDENEIRFLETPGASFQDTGFVYKSYIAADRMILTRDGYLHYRVDNAGSSVKSSSKVFCVVDEFHSIDSFIEKYPERQAEFAANYEALRYQAYQWNFNRLGWMARKEFFPAMAEDFRNADKEGHLKKSAFTVREWDRITRMIADPNEQFAREAPLISVIVPAYNCEAHLDETLESLIAQTLKNIEIVVVNDGSTDSTEEVALHYASKDGRISVVTQENGGLGCARNTGIENSVGQFISFIDGEDVVPAAALDMLYRSLVQEDADLSIGIIEEFDPIRSAQFSRTVDLSKKKTIDRYDTDLIWSFSVNNKLFKRELIEQHHLRFTDGFAEDGPFLMQYVYSCHGITGCNYTVLRYRRNLIWDGFSLTGSSKSSYVHDLVRNTEFILEKAMQQIERDLETATTEIERRRLLLTQIDYPAQIHRRLVSYLVDLQYRLLWFYDDDTVSFILSKIKEHRSFIPDNDWKQTCSYHSDLPLNDGLPTKKTLSAMPLVTISFTKELSASDVPMMLSSTYHNRFPRFELHVPQELSASIPEAFLRMDNVRVIDSAPSNASYKQASLENARSSYILFVDSPVFFYTHSLFDLWKTIDNSPADFVSTCVKHVEPESGTLKEYKSQNYLFDKQHVQGFSYRDPFNQLDCSCNNKLIKVEALSRASFAFSEDAATDCKALYDQLSFKKASSIYCYTSLPEATYLKNVDRQLITAFAPLYVANRVGNGPARKRTLKRITETIVPAIDKQRKRVHRLLKKNHAFSFAKKDKAPRVVVFSNRGLSENLKLVMEGLGLEAQYFTDPAPHSAAYDRKAVKAITQCDLLLTDDTCHYLREITLSKQQHVVQLWHACGAFKKFGLDNLKVGPLYERAAHNQYTAVMVSSDFIRPIYAQAFGIPESKVLALGVPRTDALLDAEAIQEKREKMYARYPELQGKTVYLYAPTFRQNEGVHSSWDPKIDWLSFSDALDEDELLIVKQHPLERRDLLGGRNYDRIIRLDDDANDLLSISSLLITDYSSLVFDAALLDCPTLFYCPDLTEYQTGFYVEFPNDLNGELVTQADQLLPAARSAINHNDDTKQTFFKEKYLEACDGHSTERIVSYIRTLIA